MFRWILRQLSTILKIDGRHIEYRCKKCNQWVFVTLAEQEWEQLLNGLPFECAIPNPEKLIHFKKGLCISCAENKNE